VPSYNLAFLPHFRSMSADAFQALADSKPLRREFLLKMGRTGFSPAEMDDAERRLRRAVLRLADEIGDSGGPWLLGAQITLADVAIMPVIVRLADLRLDHSGPTGRRWRAGSRRSRPTPPSARPTTRARCSPRSIRICARSWRADRADPRCARDPATQE
jgi:glutathione S-transferase